MSSQNRPRSTRVFGCSPGRAEVPSGGQRQHDLRAADGALIFKIEMNVDGKEIHRSSSAITGGGFRPQSLGRGSA
jgi:hypothetical protein